jgi:hypothetical protein
MYAQVSRWFHGYGLATCGAKRVWFHAVFFGLIGGSDCFHHAITTGVFDGAWSVLLAAVRAVAHGAPG